MNRAERRRQNRSKKTPTYNVSQAQLQHAIKKELEDAKKLAIHETTSAVVSVMLVSLHDEFGFGRVRLQRLLERFQNTYECILTDPLVKIEDFIQLCYDDYGIDIRKE